jgi:hypothetical protein
MIRTGTFRFVRYSDVDAFHRRGWMLVRYLGPVHGFWSVLMWRCDCREGWDAAGNEVGKFNARAA